MQRGVLLQGSNIRAWTRKNSECFNRGDLSHTGSDGKNQCQLFWHTTVKIINIVQFWFCIDNVFFSFFFTFFSKQILILCLSAFVLMQHIWKRILTFSGCQKQAWLKTLSRLLKNTSRLGDCWYAEIAFLILPLCWRSELGSLTSSNVLQYKHLFICVPAPSYLHPGTTCCWEEHYSGEDMQALQTSPC